MKTPPACNLGWRAGTRATRLAPFLAVAFLVAACSSNAQSDFPLVRPGSPPAPLMIDADAPPCLRWAARDFCADAREATGREMETTTGLPAATPHAIVVGVAGKSALLQSIQSQGASEGLGGQWESFRISVVPKPFPGVESALVIAGSDPRGAMYGLYETSERAFGTDPMKLWTGHVPSRRDRAAWTSGTVAQGPPTFRYRGIYVNDEDQLLAWKGEKADLVIEPEVYADLFETVCRLKGNMIAPPMTGEYMTTESRRLLDERGLLVTACHIEPLLSNPMVYWDAYCRRTAGGPLPFSYEKHADAMRGLWREGIERNRAYHNLWPLAFRGLGDVPFWANDPFAPTGAVGRGEIITRALADQMRLLREAFPGDAQPAVVNLRDELLELHQAGHLRVPDEAILVWDDWAKVGRFRQLPPPALRGRAGGNGVYHHVTAAQSQLIQSIPPSVIRGEFAKAIDTGATAYALFSVGDIREFGLSIAAGMDMVRDAGPWLRPGGDAAFLRRWCALQFGDTHADRAAALYDRLFDLENRLRVTSVLEAVAPYLYAGDLWELWDPFSAQDFAALTGEPRLLPVYTGLLDFDALPDRYWPATPAHLGALAPEWESLEGDAAALSGNLPPGSARDYCRDNLLIQARIGLRVNRWARSVLAGFGECRKTEFAKAAARFDDAAAEMECLAAERDEAARGKWRNWYRGEDELIWKKTLWTLKPARHAAGARSMASLMRAAADETTGGSVFSAIPQPAHFSVEDVRGGATESIVRLQSGELGGATQAWLAGVVEDNRSPAGAAVRVAGKDHPLPATGNQRRSIFCIPVPPAFLAAGENRFMFHFAKDDPGVAGGFKVSGLQLALVKKAGKAGGGGNDR